ncbi:c-type cytochrome biogenesis protein CcmI [Actinobacillus genomosp. 2]|uniref:c-type cytochrome biogenesis protein CcmI n=1 Tax=Actinobacillus genomosp. 2 TaxID=230709 RepID=UPI002442CA13|nr:c-type cytochrome biogenesis protein CcmI [Actinobacillus genomosp. 2]WGE31846.1 c-type cytochrome biogenesis protein CcmI [Actinobacillus genomosp. 2]
MNFWIIITLVTLVTCFIAFYPLLKKAVKSDSTKRDSLNKAFYLDRLKEVEREANEGVIDDPEKTKLELQQSLLDDIPEQKEVIPTKPSHIGKIWFVVLLLAVGIIGTTAYVSVGSWQAGTMIDMTHKKLEYFYERIKDEDTNPLSEQELNQFAMALRVELQDKPNDAKGWFMLGQIGMAKDDGQLALESYEKASKLDPKNLQYKGSYAQVLMFSQDQADKDKGKEVLKEILRQDHTNLDALSLLAFSSFEEQDYKMAAMTWGMMLKLIPEGEPRRATVEKSINMAMSMLKEQESKQPAKAEEKK